MPAQDGAGHRRPRPRRLTLRRAFTRSRQQVNARARSASPATRPHARHGAAAARARRPEHTAHRYTRSALVRNRAGFVYPGLVVEPATMAAATTASMTLTTRCAAQGFPARRLGAVTSLRARDARAPILGLPTRANGENSSARLASILRARASAVPNDTTPCRLDQIRRLRQGHRRGVRRRRHRQRHRRPLRRLAPRPVRLQR